jgi:hypothetical protein
LLENILKPTGGALYPVLSDLNMLIVTGGCERTEAEYRALYRSADFRLTKNDPNKVADWGGGDRRQANVKSRARSTVFTFSGITGIALRVPGRFGQYSVNGILSVSCGDP